MTKQSRHSYARTLEILRRGIESGGGTLLPISIFCLELPVKLLVWEERGVVSVAYTPLKETASHYGIAGMDKALGAIDRGLETLTALVA